MATLIFAHYGERQPSRISEAYPRKRAILLAKLARKYLGDDREKLVFMGRIGRRKSFKASRSVRRTLRELIVQ